jgi:adenylate cyclase
MIISGPIRAAGNRLFRFANSITADERDSEQIHLRKSTAVISAIIVAPAAILWGVVYFIAGENLAGLVPSLYAPLTILNLVLYRITHRYRVFEFSQLNLNLLLPLFLSLSLGGFVSSSGVVIWALVTPMGAIVYSSKRMSIFWFAAFLAAVIFSALIDPYLDQTNSVPGWARTGLFAGNMIGPSSIAFFLLAYFVKQNDIAYGLLNFERDRSEKLLQNVLPAKIAARLKDGTQNVADRFDQISVLFADMVGSTVLATSLTPEDMVGLLNEIFTEFDSITLRHGVEKISTSGDNYLVAAGVPEVRPDHAIALVRVAIEMRNYLEERRKKLPEASQELTMRFGINTGAAVAGVVGQRNFHYDIWGDAVNTASRMESHGEPGRIQISEATYNLVKDEFECELRGEIDVKGKGMMRTWWVKD